MSRTERARQRKFRRNFLMFVGAQLLIAALAFVFVRDYMSDGSIRHAIVKAVGQLGNDSKQAKSVPNVAVPVTPPSAATPGQDIATIQETPAVIESPVVPTPATQAAAVPAEPQVEPVAETPIANVEPEAQAAQQAKVPEAASEPQPVAQAAPVLVEPQPTPEPQVEPLVEAQAVAPEPQPAVEEVAAAAVPDISSQSNDPAAVAEQKEGLTFRDCDLCPELVSVASGQFLVGAGGQGIAQPSPSAKPQEVVVDKPFAIGRYEITFDDWERCVKDGVCTTQPSDDGWGRGRRPVIHVSYNDITGQYLPWL